MTAYDDLLKPQGGIHPLILPACQEILGAAEKALGRPVPACSWFNPASTPEHHVPGMAGQKGVACDFMVYKDRELGDWIAAYAWEHRVRLGVRWIIWRDRIRSRTAGRSGEWEARGKGDHFDHPHINFGSLVGQSGYGSVPRVVYRPLVVTPYVWDGKSYPGADRLKLGASGPWVTWLGERLVAHGWTGYSDGPGPTLTATDVAGVKWAQQQQGFTGKDADGVAGAQTWAWLAAAPIVPPKPKPPTQQTPEPTKPTEGERVLQFTVGGANILRETDDLEGRKRWPARRANVVKALQATKGTVLLICEADKSTADDIARGLGQAWSYYPSSYKSGKEFSPLAVLWDSRVWRREADASVTEYRDNQNRFLMILPLVHKATGKVVQFYVSHLENDGDPNTNGGKARQTEAKQWGQLTRSGRGVFYADLNSTTASGAGGDVKPRPILKAAGWGPFLSDKRFIPNGELASHHGGLDATPKGDWIDDMGLKGLPFVTGAVIRTDGTDASDHHFFSITTTL